jgi:hypothetical protein
MTDIGTIRQGLVILNDSTDGTCWGRSIEIPKNVKGMEKVSDGAIAYLDDDGVLRFRNEEVT